MCKFLLKHVSIVLAIQSVLLLISAQTSANSVTILEKYYNLDAFTIEGENEYSEVGSGYIELELKTPANTTASFVLMLNTIPIQNVLVYEQFKVTLSIPNGGGDLKVYKGTELVSHINLGPGVITNNEMIGQFELKMVGNIRRPVVRYYLFSQEQWVSPPDEANDFLEFAVQGIRVAQVMRPRGHMFFKGGEQVVHPHLPFYHLYIDRVDGQTERVHDAYIDGDL